jgi:D-inositol-3-phosphate glycosyltransferase
VVFVAPRPHELLSTYYRAADVCLVPSRSESFGLVALESAACGTPVVASDVGGLRTLVDHGRTGYLVDDPTAEAFAAWVRQILAEPLLGERLGTGAVLRARRYTWARAAHLLREIYAELTVGRLVECS